MYLPNDIISCNERIKLEFENEFKRVEVYEKLLQYSDNEKITELLRDSIEESRTKKTYLFYLSSTMEIISEYKKILKIPIKVNFMGVQLEDKNKDYKNELVSNYLTLVKIYIKEAYERLSKIYDYFEEIKLDDINNIHTKILDENGNRPFEIDFKNIESVLNKSTTDTKCPSCKKNNTFDNVEDITNICVECGYEKIIPISTSSYQDIDRINITTKYTYDRKIHFRDCINQYQAVFVFKIIVKPF